MEGKREKIETTKRERERKAKKFKSRKKIKEGGYNTQDVEREGEKRTKRVIKQARTGG